MHDAVALANWIVSMESPSMVDVTQAFKEYYAERFPIVQEELEQNQGFTSILGKVRNQNIALVCLLNDNERF